MGIRCGIGRRGSIGLIANVMLTSEAVIARGEWTVVGDVLILRHETKRYFYASQYSN